MKDPHDIRKAAIEDAIIAKSEERESTWPGVCPKCHYATDHCLCGKASAKCKHDLFADTCPYCELAQLRAKCERLEAQLEESFKGVLCIRCTKHVNITPYNTREINGGECPACEIEQLRQDRDHLDQQHRTLLQDKNALQSVIEQCEKALMASDQFMRGCDQKHFINLREEALSAIRALKEQPK